MTCHVGPGIVVCTGLSGWRVTHGTCPWCAPVAFGTQTRQLSAWIFGGYCGQRRICGECGYEGETEDEGLRDVSDERREQNKARVASVADPKCWSCHDTGDAGMPWDEPGTHPCQRCREGEGK